MTTTEVSTQEILKVLDYGMDRLTETELKYLLECKEVLEKKREQNRACSKRFYNKLMDDDDMKSEYRAKKNKSAREYYAKNKERLKRQKAESRCNFTHT